MCEHSHEDEVHLLFQRTAYTYARNIFTQPVSQPNWNNVRNILVCENQPKAINLSK